MRPKLDRILARALEEGLQAGVRRAHKHTEWPSEELLLEHLEREVWLALDEVFEFEALDKSQLEEDKD